MIRIMNRIAPKATRNLLPQRLFSRKISSVDKFMSYSDDGPKFCEKSAWFSISFPVVNRFIGCQPQKILSRSVHKFL